MAEEKNSTENMSVVVEKNNKNVAVVVAKKKIEIVTKKMC